MFFSKAPSPSDREALLREGLVFLLERYQEAAPQNQTRIERLRARLNSNHPPPTGLLAKLGRLKPPRAERSNEALPELVSEVLTATVKALSVAAIPSPRISKKLDDFVTSLPPKLGVGDSRRVIRQLNELRASLQPLQREDLSLRKELVSLVGAISSEISSASTTSSQLDSGLKDVTAKLTKLEAPEDVRALRTQITAQVRSISRDAKALRSQLKDAQDQAGALAEVVKRQSEELIDLREKSAQDALTGVGNRRAFDTWMRQILPSAQRREEQVTLLLLDIDKFKTVNDTWGHPAGDAVLESVARVLAAGVRDGDEVFRVGGEEFAVVLHGASQEVATLVSERLRTSIHHSPVAVEGADIIVTMSGGLAILAHDDNVDTLYKRADEALYASKHGGRDRLTVAA